VGSQVPPNTVRFDASFGRRLLHDPAYLRVGALARCAWFEANLIATEFDGVFAEEALVARMTQALSFYTSSPEVTGLWPWGVVPRGIIIDECLDPLVTEGLITSDDHGWYRINGWEKWQPDPLATPKKSTEEKRRAHAEAQKRLRDRKRDQRDLRDPNVTSRARASSSSSSSSLSERVAHEREGDDTNAILDAMRRRGMPVDAPGRPHVLTDTDAAV